MDQWNLMDVKLTENGSDFSSFFEKSFKKKKKNTEQQVILSIVILDESKHTVQNLILGVLELTFDHSKYVT